MTIPYSPTFVAQVQSGNVASLTARDSVIQGSLKQAILYLANDAKGRATSEFATQVPAFANTDGLDRLLTRDLRGRGRDDMVARFGMSEEIGFVSVLPVGGNGSALMPGVSEVSERTRRRIDDEIRRIVREREALNDAIKLLAENRHRLDTLAEALVSAETLGENEAYAAAGIDAPVGVTRRRSSRQ